MSKENQSAAEDAAETPVYSAPIFPKWFYFVALVMIIVAALMLATAGTRQHAKAIEAFNTAQIEVNYEYPNRLPQEYAVTIFKTPNKGYLEILGASKTDPQRAIKVYRELLDGNGTTAGKVLACHLALYLAQDGQLNTEDFQRLVKAVDASQHADVRGMAQSSLSQLIAVTDVNRKAEVETLPAMPANLTPGKTKWSAQTITTKWGPNDFYKQQIEYMQVVWSNPDACQAWWTQYTKPLTWNEHLLRFELPAK